MRCLEYIAKEGNSLPYQEVAKGLNENPQRVRGALNDASNEGYLSFGRDDVTGQGGYSLTSKGAARVKNGHMTVNGEQASENSAACEARENEEAMPEPDPVLLASANRMLSEKNDNLQKRVERLQSDRVNQTTLLAAKTERIAALEKEVEELQDCTADELVGTVASLMQENAELRKEAADARDALEEAQRELMKGATLANSALMQNPIGWAHVWSEGFTRFDTEDAARKDIERSFIESNSIAVDESHLCAIIDTAEMSVKWVRS